MNKIGMAIRELHRSENALAAQLLRLADRHQTDHEVHHLGRDLAHWSRHHVAELARVGHDYGVDLDPEPRDGVRPLATARQRAAQLVGRRPEPAVLLLADLRRLFRRASGVSLDWEILAQAPREPELLALAKRLHPQTLRQARWANTKLKEASAQALTS